MDELLVFSANAGLSNPILRHLAVFLSSVWVPILVGLVLLVALLRRRRYAAVLSILLASAAADMTTSRVLKPFVGRERPCRSLEGLDLAVPCGTGKSFPSGHSSNAFAVAVAAAPALESYGYRTLLPLAAGVALSRVFLGVHYPTDILAGALLGTLIGFAAHLGRKRWEARGTRVSEAEAASAG